MLTKLSKQLRSQSPLFLLALVVVVGLLLFTRFYKLSSFPPALYWEEVALGYDAYSLLQTGKDHHGQAWPIVAAESFGDWKPTGYMYALLPFIKLFGLNEWSVRLPAATAGVALVIGVGFLALEWERLHPKTYQRRGLFSLVAMAVATISPWALNFSRAAWEGMVAAALTTWFIVLLWQQLRIGLVKPTLSLTAAWRLWLAVLLAIAAMYTYHAARIVVPLLGVALVLVYVAEVLLPQWRVIQKNVVNTHLVPGVVILTVLLVCLWPLLGASQQSSVTHRFSETSIFSDPAVLIESNSHQQVAGNSLLSRVLYHRYVLYSRELLKQFLLHFEPTFLFIRGDINVRHSIQFFGQLYHIEAVFLLLGIYAVSKYGFKRKLFLASWLVIGIIPAIITAAAPHSLRTLTVLPLVLLVVSIGLYYGVTTVNDWLATVSLTRRLSSPHRLKAIVGVVIVLYALEFGWLWRFYTTIYPKFHAGEWQYGYKEAMLEVAKLAQASPEQRVYITREMGRPSMYYWFFTQTDPRQVQAANQVEKKDQGEFASYHQFTFPNSTDEVISNGIVASSPQGFENLEKRVGAQKITEIKDPTNRVVWVISKVEQYR